MISTTNGIVTARGCIASCNNITINDGLEISNIVCCNTSKCNNKLRNRPEFFSIVYLLIFPYFIMKLIN